MPIMYYAQRSNAQVKTIQLPWGRFTPFNNKTDAINAVNRSNLPVVVHEFFTHDFMEETHAVLLFNHKEGSLPVSMFDSLDQDTLEFMMPRLIEEQVSQMRTQAFLPPYFAVAEDVDHSLPRLLNRIADRFVLAKGEDTDTFIDTTTLNQQACAQLATLLIRTNTLMTILRDRNITTDEKISHIEAYRQYANEVEGAPSLFIQGFGVLLMGVAVAAALLLACPPAAAALGVTMGMTYMATTAATALLGVGMFSYGRRATGDAALVNEFADTANSVLQTRL